MISERVETKILNRKTMKELIDRLKNDAKLIRVWAQNSKFVKEAELQNRHAEHIEKIISDLESLQSKGKTKEEVTAIPWQSCPICNGSGQMYEPLSTGTFRACPTCNGQRIIPMHVTQPQP